MQQFDQLPDSLPVFPLTNAVVLPGGVLPLNIFEPRYLNMLQDAMESHHLIGMIQPLDEKQNPELYKVGCAGRITRYEEMRDGRLEIQLTGLCRFHIKEELSSTRGYRLIVPDWSHFSLDYEAQAEPDSEVKNAFVRALRSYFEHNNMKVESDVMDKLSVEELSNGLFGYLNLAAQDKQMLIEMDTLEQRVKALTALLDNHTEISNVRH